MHASWMLTALLVASIVSLIVHVALMATFRALLRRGRRQRFLVGPRGISRQNGNHEGPPCIPSLVSILKPLAGHDDDLDLNLASFASLTGVRYEILFGVASPSDPALRAARRFVADHPTVATRILITDRSCATNPKIAQLIALAAAARGDVLVTSDSNVRVASDYLRRLTEPLADPRVGIVTNLFTGSGEHSLGAALENLQLAATITPSVVLSTLALPVTVGKSMAMRKADLAALGGFAAFGDVLAEDLMLGRRFAAAGLAIATVFDPVENRNVDGSIARTFERHVRWSKMRRSIQPWFFAIEPLFSPIIVSSVALLAMPSRVLVAMLGVAMLVQTATSLSALRAVRGRGLSWKLAPLETVRAYLMFGCWLASCASRTIVWRGNAFTLGRGSVITPLVPGSRRSRPGISRIPNGT